MFAIKVLRIIIFLSFVLLIACENKPKQTTVLPVTVSQLTTTKIPLRKTYIGTTQSIAAVGIKARVEGFLTQMNFVEGKPVKKGQLLFVIDPKPFEADLSLAKGELARSIANMQYQQVQYYRLKELVKKGDVSQSNYDEVAAKYALQRLKSKCKKLGGNSAN